MPAAAPEQIVRAIIDAIAESGSAAVLASPARRNPRRFLLTGQGVAEELSCYAWTLTSGGRPSLGNEYRIQMTSVKSPLEVASHGPTVVVGYEPRLNLFAGFDLERHRVFTAGSPSVQIDVNELQQAETDGLSFHRKSNDEIAIGIRPDMFIVYATNAAVLHRYGREANILRLLNAGVRDHRVSETDLKVLSKERRRVVMEVTRLSREAKFKHQVLFAYGYRCAVTRIQLRLVEAAHILPVAARGSVDVVQNGIALSPTYHRAFDAGLIYLDEGLSMRLSEGSRGVLQRLNLAGGLDAFSAPLGPIFLPPDALQRPSANFIKRANQFRQIAMTEIPS